MSAQTLESIKDTIAKCSFNEWTFRVGVTDNTPYLQVLFVDKDRITGEEEIQRCRKWQLSYYMVTSELIRTAFKAVEAAMQHEVEEAFKYNGARIYNPHLDLEELAFAINNRTVSVSLRDEAEYKPSVGTLPEPPPPPPVRSVRTAW